MFFRMGSVLPDIAQPWTQPCRCRSWGNEVLGGRDPLSLGFRQSPEQFDTESSRSARTQSKCFGAPVRSTPGPCVISVVDTGGLC